MSKLNTIGRTLATLAGFALLGGVVNAQEAGQRRGQESAQERPTQRQTQQQTSERGQQQTGLQADAHQQLLEAAQQLQQAGMSLEDAVRKAEQQTNGKALVARTMVIDGNLWNRIKQQSTEQGERPGARPNGDKQQEQRTQRPNGQHDQSQQPGQQQPGQQQPGQAGQQQAQQGGQQQPGHTMHGQQGERLVFEVICAKSGKEGAKEGAREAGQSPEGMRAGRTSAGHLVVVYVDAQSGSVHSAGPLPGAGAGR